MHTCVVSHQLFIQTDSPHHTTLHCSAPSLELCVFSFSTHHFLSSPSPRALHTWTSSHLNRHRKHWSPWRYLNSNSTLFKKKYDVIKTAPNTRESYCLFTRFLHVYLLIWWMCWWTTREWEWRVARSEWTWRREWENMNRQLHHVTGTSIELIYLLPPLFFCTLLHCQLQFLLPLSMCMSVFLSVCLSESFHITSIPCPSRWDNPRDIIWSLIPIVYHRLKNSNNYWLSTTTSLYITLHYVTLHCITLNCWCFSSSNRGDSSARGRRVWAGGVEPTDTTYSNPKATTDGAGTTADTWYRYCTTILLYAYSVSLHHLRHSHLLEIIQSTPSLTESIRRCK